MAYNKSKYVEAAQKLLNQGKVPQAIAEYQQILKYEPKDQVTLMTIDYLLGAIVTVGLLVYLVYVLIRPEKF